MPHPLWVGRNVPLAVPQNEVYRQVKHPKPVEPPTIPWDSSLAPIPPYQTYKDFLEGLSQYHSQKHKSSIESKLMIAAMRFLVDEAFRHRIYVDTTIRISATSPIRVNTFDRAYLYIRSTISLVLTGIDGSTISVVAGQWTDITSTRGQELFPLSIPDSAPIYVIIRSTDSLVDAEQNINVTQTNGNPFVREIVCNTVTAFGQNLLPITDVSSYQQVSLQLEISGSATFTIFGGNDANSMTTEVFGFSIPNTFASRQFSSSDLILIPTPFRFLLITATSFSGGSTANGFIQCMTYTPGYLPNQVTQVIPKGIVYVYQSQNKLAVAAGVGTADVVVLSQPGMLSTAVVTAVGTADLVLFDNASVSAGDIIGVIPASSTRGQIFNWHGAVLNGIVAKQLNGTPAVTIWHQP